MAELPITAKPGTKVTVTKETITQGWPSDARKAELFLKPGEQYTVKEVEIHSWHTRVYLEEVPNQYFNSVNFELWE